jgi:hypothetical protein
MSKQETPLDPERQHTNQRRMFPEEHVHNAHAPFQQPRLPVLPSILLLVLGFLVIAILYGIALMQFDLLNANTICFSPAWFAYRSKVRHIQTEE